MKRSAALALVALLFAVGVVSGALGAHLFYAHQLARPGGPREMIARGFEGQLRRELRLSQDQLDQIRGILDEGHAESERIRSEVAPRIHEHMDRLHARIMDVLTPEQRQRFTELHERHRRRADAFMLGPDAPPPHGPEHGPDHRPRRRTR